MKTILNIIMITVLAFAIISCSEDDPVSTQHDHAEAEGLVLKTDGNTIMKIFEGEFDSAYFDTLSIKANSTMQNIEIFFLDHDGDEFQTDDEDKALGWIIGDETMLTLTLSESNKWMVDVEALKEGNTDLELRILHNDHPDFKSPKIPVVITK